MPSGRGLATPGGGPRGCCWPVRWPWRCWPRLVSGQLLVFLMPMALHRVLSLRLLSLMLGVVVAEVALLAVPLLMPVTVSLVLMMLRALLVALVWVRVWAVSGLCPDVAWAVSVPGWGLGGRWRWPVPAGSYRVAVGGVGGW